MTITRVVDGNTSAATNLNQLIDLMEGAESIDFLLKSLTATDFKVRLADAAGARKLIIQDSAGATVATIDSDGNATFTSITLTSFVLPSAASPSQTADASVVWDSDNDYLTIGDGTSRKSFQPDGQGSDLASASTITPTHRYHRVTGTTTITAIGTMPAGFKVGLTFAGVLQLTHSTGLRLSGAANYTTTAEETIEFESDGTNWREIGRKPVAATSLPWTKVSAGSGTATGLTLSSLSGYRRYQLYLYVESLAATVTMTFNGVSTGSYRYGYQSVSPSTGSASANGAATDTSITVIPSFSAHDNYIVMNVGHNGGSAARIAATWSAAGDANVTGGAQLTTDQTSITSIALSWTNSYVYNYVLLGSNDVT